MSIFAGGTEIKDVYLGEDKLKEAYVGDIKVRPSIDTNTFTITWTEQSDMSSGWVYSDGATGLTAGDGAFDDFFGYSAVLLNTNGVETAEMKQTGGVFTGTMDTLGNITSGDNVMIKFPVLGVKMTKSGSTVTLSLTKEKNKDGFQYYAHSTGTITSPGRPKDAFYIGAYEGYAYGTTLKSWSGKTPTTSQTQATFCTQARENNTNLGWNIVGFYQREYINALYMMKYGNPNSQSVIGQGVVGDSGAVSTGGTNSQTKASYGTTSIYQHTKLFGIEDWWGNVCDWVGGMYTDTNKVLYTQLSGYSGSLYYGTSTGTTIQQSGSSTGISSIAGNNKAMFAPIATTGGYSTYYCDLASVVAYRLACAGGYWSVNSSAGAFYLQCSYTGSSSGSNIGARLMYL